MNFTPDEQAALQALVKNFKCQVCGNTKIEFDNDIYFEPAYSDATADKPGEWVRIARGRCSWCGMVIEFDMEKVMESYAIMTKKTYPNE